MNFFNTDKYIAFWYEETNDIHIGRIIGEDKDCCGESLAYLVDSDVGYVAVTRSNIVAKTRSSSEMRGLMKAFNYLGNRLKDIEKKVEQLESHKCSGNCKGNCHGKSNS